MQRITNGPFLYTSAASTKRTFAAQHTPKETMMKASSNLFAHDCGPMDHGFEHSGRHWHQPTLPSEILDPFAAFATAMAGMLSRLRAVRQCAVTTLALWAERERSRRELEELSDYTLRDVGLTRADVWREASKPWWRA